MKLSDSCLSCRPIRQTAGGSTHTLTLLTNLREFYLFQLVPPELFTHVCAAVLNKVVCE